LPKRRSTNGIDAGGAAAAAPRIFFWGARALYLGPAAGLSAHRNAVAVLCAGLDEPFGLAIDPPDPPAGHVACSTALVPPGTRHHLAAPASTMAFLYLDAWSADWQTLSAQSSAGYGIAAEYAYLAALARLEAGLPWSSAREEIAAALGLAAPQRTDPRIAAMLRQMRESPAETHPLAAAARAASLSPSRLQHLFKESTGVPFRRYRLWIRMGAAIRSLAAGASMTDSAMAAGFASSAHFSTAFRDMFGLQPSWLQKARLALPAHAAGS
jgi:AraC-like DNA-binding protein